METTSENAEAVSIRRVMALDFSADNDIASEISVTGNHQEKNTRGLIQLARARKSQFLIVDDEWW